MSNAFSALQQVLPKRALTRAAGALAASERPWLKRLLIDSFLRAYPVNLDEAAEARSDFVSFNHFFTRALKPGLRPVDPNPNTLVSPADGVVSQCGAIDAGTLLQAKGTRYPLSSLAGELGDGFDGGQFVTIYLAPVDYHRVHTPASGELNASIAMPGEFFSVNARTEAGIADLFCRNERLIGRVRGPEAERDYLLIMVGALIVGKIETVFDSPAGPYRSREHRKHSHSFERGDEFGRFLLGSTVVLCFRPGAFVADSGIEPGARLRVGQRIGTWAE